MYLAGIEAGGTKFFTTIGDMQGNIIERHRTDTTDPRTTLIQILQILKQYQSQYRIKAIGVACFGPIDININSKTYGHITSTPKISWQDFDILSSIKSIYQGPVGFNTDVNAAAVCEQLWGAGKNINNVLYLTIGTGIGGGVICNNQLVQGEVHPEIGHIFIPQISKDKFQGSCPFHNNCLEGLASGTALKERYNFSSADKIPDNHEAWVLEAKYLATAIVNYIYAFSPEKIILGGGIMNKKILFNLIRDNVVKYLNGYLNYSALQNMQTLIVPATFGENTGVKGSLALALQTYQND